MSAVPGPRKLFWRVVIPAALPMIMSGVRLSCQILCEGDMTVRATSRLAGSGRPDAGRTPDAAIQPPPEWI